MILSLKKVVIMFAAGVLLGVLVGYGMNFLTQEETPSKITSILIEGSLELKLGLDKTEFEQGEPINITVSLKNLGNTTVEVFYNNGGSKVGFKVLHANDTIATVWGRSPLTYTEKVFLAPNEQVSNTCSWDQYVCFVGTTETIIQKAPRGTYKIVGITGAKITIVGTEFYGDPETPPITITITLARLRQILALRILSFS